MMKCEEMKLYAITRIPQATLEHCKQVQVYHTQESKTGGMKILSTASTSVTVYGPKKAGTFDPNNEEDTDQFSYTIPELYLTTYDENDKFKTVEEEGIE